MLHTNQGGSDLGCSARIQPIESTAVRTAAFGVQVLPDLSHHFMVSYMLPLISGPESRFLPGRKK